MYNKLLFAITETEVAHGPIYKGNNATNPNSSNMDGPQTPLTSPDDVKVKPDKEEEPAKKVQTSGRKEKSVLQAKLTKLAIQIGYAGRCLMKL